MTCARRAIPGLLLAAATLSLAAPPPDMGEVEYTLNCAKCHGMEARGNGPLADVGTPRAADLTQLSSRNGGSFPYVAVFEAIEGSRHDAMPGSAMPAWKGYYLEEAERAGPVAPFDAEGYLRTRMLAISEYLTRIQE